MRLAVTVESWGEHCGPEPKSYASSRARPVEINDLGSHLVFSSGGVRTDRCWSPNPRLVSMSELIAPGRWERVCQTQKGDPKFERGEYSLVAKSASLLEYKALSRFDWTLKESHCAALLEERRTYARQDVQPDNPPHEPEGKVSTESDKGEVAAPGCAKPGPLAHFSIAPRKAVLGAGQRACFKVTATDAKGCKVGGSPVWTAFQGGVEVPGLLSSGGCFSAGDTAADAEGRYTVKAKLAGRGDEVEVLVSFPELGELLAARLKPYSDADSDSEPTPTVPASKAEPLPQPPVLKTSRDKGSLVWIALVAALALAASLGATLLWLLKKRAEVIAQAEEQAENRAAKALDAVNPPLPAKKACPECGRTYETDASFCPHDRSRLIELQAFTDTSTRSPSPASGMVCPRCHRGYEAGARFCPHDAEALIAYSEWKVTRQSKAPRSS